METLVCSKPHQVLPILGMELICNVTYLLLVSVKPRPTNDERQRLKRKGKEEKWIH